MSDQESVHQNRPEVNTYEEGEGKRSPEKTSKSICGKTLNLKTVVPKYENGDLIRF